MDKELLKYVELAKKGDDTAIANLIEHYNSKMLNLARMYTKTDADAQDALQNAHIRCFKSINSLEKNEKFESFLSQIVVNEAKRIVMSSYKEKNVMFSELDNEDEDMAYDPADERITYQPEMSYSQKQTKEMVMDILDNLSDDQRIVALMHFYENKTLREISEELEIPQSTVIGRIQTAKKNIKASVLHLEKTQGIKLYNLTPIAFFKTLLQVLETGNTIATVATVTSIGGTTAGTLATIKNVIFAGTAGKVLAGTALTLAVVGGTTIASQQVETVNATKKEDIIEVDTNTDTVLHDDKEVIETEKNEKDIVEDVTVNKAEKEFYQAAGYQEIVGETKIDRSDLGDSSEIVEASTEYIPVEEVTVNIDSYAQQAQSTPTPQPQVVEEVVVVQQQEAPVEVYVEPTPAPVEEVQVQTVEKTVEELDAECKMKGSDYFYDTSFGGCSVVIEHVITDDMVAEEGTSL